MHLLIKEIEIKFIKKDIFIILNLLQSPKMFPLNKCINLTKYNLIHSVNCTAEFRFGF